MSRNLAILVGRLGRDPEYKELATGPMLKFTVATSERYQDKMTKDFKEKTEWHNVVVFGNSVPFLSINLQKGSMVYVEGKIQTTTYEKEGHKFYSTSINARNVQVLGGKKSKEEANGNLKDPTPMLDKQYEIKESNDYKLDDIPF